MISASGASTGQDSSSPVGAIVGGVLGSVILVLVVVGGIIVMYRRGMACFQADDTPAKSFDNPTYDSHREEVKVEGLPGELEEDDGGYVTMDNRK